MSDSVKVSISSISLDMRSPSWQMVFKKLSCWAESTFLKHSAEDKITARGVRSSWEAAAIKWVCLCWLSCIGLKRIPVKNHEKSANKRTAARSINRKRMRC